VAGIRVAAFVVLAGSSVQAIISSRKTVNGYNFQGVPTVSDRPPMPDYEAAPEKLEI
jgi:hypothetical protein